MIAHAAAHGGYRAEANGAPIWEAADRKLAATRVPRSRILRAQLWRRNHIADRSMCSRDCEALREDTLARPVISRGPDDDTCARGEGRRGRLRLITGPRGVAPELDIRLDPSVGEGLRIDALARPVLQVRRPSDDDAAVGEGGG